MSDLLGVAGTAVTAYQLALGTVGNNIANVSTTGFMVKGEVALQRGERITIRLHHIGRIEAFLVWSDGARAGFQFERILRTDDFLMMIKSLQPNPKLHRPR
jgi:flagellar hook-associated protein FlgK